MTTASRLNTALSNAIQLAGSPHLYTVEKGELDRVASNGRPATEREKTDFLNRQIQVIQDSPLEDLWRERERIRDLFFQILPPWDYNRGAIAVGGSLEYILDPKVHFAHQDEDFDPVTDRKIRETVLEALFACRLGVKPEKADSAFHEVYYLLDRSGKRLGVFKPRMNKSFLNDCYGASEDREAHLAEVANYLLDAQLKTRLVPHTERMSCHLPAHPEPIAGSFQFYVSDPSFLEAHLEGEEFFNPDHAKLAEELNTKANRELSLPNFEKMALFGLATANNDHHFRNLLKKPSGELVAIDGGNSFPWCHNLDLPFYKMRPLHWFKWSTLPHAQAPFSPAMVAEINRLNLSEIERILRSTLVDPEVPSSQQHIEGKMETLRDRIETIKTLANRRVSIREIGNAILKLSHRKSACCSAKSTVGSLWQRFVRPLLGLDTVESFLAKVC